jgi:hypothetical protein
MELSRTKLQKLATLANDQVRFTIYATSVIVASIKLMWFGEECVLIANTYLVVTYVYEFLAHHWCNRLN